MKYRKATIQPKGFGKVDTKLAEKVRGESVLLVLGYARWIDFADVEPDTMAFVQKFWDEGNQLLDTLAEGDIWTARNLLEEGPWSYEDLGVLVRDLDEWAMVLSDERQVIGSMPLEEVRKTLHHGLEVYHDALLKHHSASAEATDALQEALEAHGLELWDTGAMYDREGNQEGPRDLVMGVPNTETEYAFRVYHSPRKAEYNGALPDAIQETVKQWESAL